MGAKLDFRDLQRMRRLRRAFLLLLAAAFLAVGIRHLVAAHVEEDTNGAAAAKATATRLHAVDPDSRSLEVDKSTPPPRPPRLPLHEDEDDEPEDEKEDEDEETLTYQHDSNDDGASASASASAAATATTTTTTTRVAVILPYTEEGNDYELDRLLSTIEGWAHPACTTAAAKPSVGLFYYGAAGGDDGLDEHLRASAAAAAKGLVACLGEVGALEAGLEEFEHVTEEGEGKESEKQSHWEHRRQRRLSQLFYRLLLDEDGHRDDALGEYTHVLWLDWRVAQPLRAGWLDAIASTAASPSEGGLPFWVRGGHYQGQVLDEAVVVTGAEAAEQLRRLNGNALYALREPEFETFLRIVQERRPPSVHSPRFDAALWRVLHDLPYSWKAYQAHRPKFQHAPRLLTHLDVNAPAPKEGEGEDESAPYLVIRELAPAPHGPDDVDEKVEIVSASVRLSVLVRTFSHDLDLAAVAFQSAKRFLPHALEYVAVVPEPDVPQARATLPDFVEVKGEPILMPDQSTQQKYTKLMGETYCQGDFILHLDSDVVFHRHLLYKDLFLLGKPTLEYDTYANLEDTGAGQWQQGTAFAVGKPILYEYSRSNEHVYPRHVYGPARRHIEERFKGLPFVEFLATRPGSKKGKAKASHRQLDAKHIPEGEATDRGDLFSDFNYIGAFLHHHMPDAVAWRYLGGDGAGMQPPETALEQVIRPRFTCQGNGRWTEKHPAKRAEQLRHLRDIAHGKAHGCGALYEFLEGIRPKGRKGKRITEKRK